MDSLAGSDTTSLSYWLNWRFFLCTLWVLLPMLGAGYIIWKHEHSDPSEFDSKGTQEDDACFCYASDSWRPCVKEIHPICLMNFRIFAFFLNSTALILDVVLRGGSLFFYYTQWSFALVTIYFGLGSLLSIYGCSQHRKCSKHIVCHEEVDAERGSYVSLLRGEAAYEVNMEKYPYHHQKYHLFQTALGWGRVFQIVFQMTAGAVVLTDCLYWCVIFPFLTIKDYDFSFFTIMEHSLNAILLLGDTILNGMRFPWFRISYFILLTGVYVIFQWIVHASVSMWWPYPFLDLSSAYAPVWYLAVALMHLPCYTLFALIIKLKFSVLSRWFPQSDQILS